VARILTYAAIVVTALVLQLSVLDTLPLPGGSAPDVVLLVVVAIALTGGPLAGAVTGFAGGLTMDLAPPASHSIGEYALVFCLVGYACGRAAGEIDRSAFLPLVAMTLGVVGGSILYTVVGVTFGEADVTWAAAQRVLPVSVAYDVVVSPFVLYAVMRLTRWAGMAAEDPAAAMARAGVGAIGSAGVRGGKAAQPRQPRQPRIRPGAGRASGWIGAAPPSAMAAVASRSSGGFGSSLGGGRTAGGYIGSNGRNGPGGRQSRPPKLRFGSSGSPGTSRSGLPGVFTGGSLIGGSTVRLRLGTGRASRLWSRTARLFGFGPRSRQPAQPRFAPAKSTAAFRNPAAGSRRGPAARLRRGPGARFRAGGTVAGFRGGGPGAGFRRGRRSGLGPAAGFRRGQRMGLRRVAGWLPTWRSRRRRPTVWRTSGGTGGTGGIGSSGGSGGTGGTGGIGSSGGSGRGSKTAGKRTGGLR
jgi:rod shape-determining protein MreD